MPEIDHHKELMKLLAEENNNMTNDIKEIERKITLEREQLNADRGGLEHIECEIASVADAESAIQAWRVQMARLSRPSVLIPKNMLENQRSLSAHTATKSAIEASISEREDKIRELEADLTAAKERAFDDAWQIISAECDRLADRLAVQQAAYTETARQLFGLVQTARQGEHLSPRAQRLYAPEFWDRPRTAREQADGMDMGMYRQQIAPFVSQASEWRTALASDQQAAAPF